jgi:hypothetical protein
VPLSQDVSPR